MIQHTPEDSRASRRVGSNHRHSDSRRDLILCKLTSRLPLPGHAHGVFFGPHYPCMMRQGKGGHYCLCVTPLLAGKRRILQAFESAEFLLFELAFPVPGAFDNPLSDEFCGSTGFMRGFSRQKA
mmetsp:Transcript_5399/g.16120  ORF Transcript_5399/g.16120 Transcript_5399/m.16120 type:complete len:124 (-) Transcript_5399:230-601(-)